MNRPPVDRSTSSYFGKHLIWVAMIVVLVVVFTMCSQPRRAPTHMEPFLNSGCDLGRGECEFSPDGGPPLRASVAYLERLAEPLVQVQVAVPERDPPRASVQVVCLDQGMAYVRGELRAAGAALYAGQLRLPACDSLVSMRQMRIILESEGGSMVALFQLSPPGAEAQ